VWMSLAENGTISENALNAMNGGLQKELKALYCHKKTHVFKTLVLHQDMFFLKENV